MLSDWLAEAIVGFTNWWPAGTMLSYTFMVKAFIAGILVSLICGAVGSLVVGNRMAFFSDALAHTAFAGVALGLLLGLLTGAARGSFFYLHGIPFIMVGFGVVVGLAIAFVRERTGLTSDTVIGVFFAWAVGFGAVLLSAVGKRGYFRVEQFIFGDPLAISETGLLVLALLGLLTLGLLLFMYNQLLFASFNPSLARSRNISVRLGNYLFIALLAMIVNLCVSTVGALLINAMLVVPAATAANLCRNMRQMFWVSILLSLLASVGGIWFTFAFHPVIGGSELELGASGVVVVLTVLLFFASMIVGPWWKGRSVDAPPAAAKA